MKVFMELRRQSSVDWSTYRGALSAGYRRLYKTTAVQAVLNHSLARERPGVRLFHDQYTTCTDTKEITTGKSPRKKEM
jgi:hypothetical protein